MSKSMLHILSAVVRTLPATQDLVARRIAAYDGVDVLAVDHGRIIVVLEASDQRILATRSIASPAWMVCCPPRWCSNIPRLMELLHEPA